MGWLARMRLRRQIRVLEGQARASRALWHEATSDFDRSMHLDKALSLDGEVRVARQALVFRKVRVSRTGSRRHHHAKMARSVIALGKRVLFSVRFRRSAPPGPPDTASTALPGR